MPNDGSKKPGSRYGPKDGREKLLRQGTLLQSRLTRFGGCAWKMSCCGIFCDPQEGSESKGKVCSDLPPQERVSHCCNVQILFSIEKRLLQLCKADEPARKGCCPCRNNPAAARQMLSHLRLPTYVAVAEKQQKDLSQPQNHPACYEEIRPAGRDSPPQKVAADGPAGTQIPESSQPRLSRRSTKPQMGNGPSLTSTPNKVCCTCP